ncbi:MAG: MlaD family protein [bacterium]
MEYTSSEVKVGAMLVVGFGLFVAFLIAIFGVTWNENTNEYQTCLKQIPGIVEGSLVKYGGMDVGVVTEIALPGSEDEEALIRLKLEVDGKTPVRMNSLAFVTSIGIMSDQHIEISPGSPDSPIMPSGGTLQSKEIVSFMQMAEPFSEMSNKLQVLIERTSEILNEENQAHLASTMASIDRLVTDGGDRFVELVDNLDTLTRNLAEVSQSLNALMADNKDNFDETLAHLETTTRETSALISDVRRALGEFESMISANGASFVEIMENFQYTSQNLEEFTRIVKERPWLLVRKAAPPERKFP